MKIVTIVGARPQFIKAAPLSVQFLKNGIEEVIIHTGQHYDKNMSDIFFDELSVPRPKYILQAGGLSHAASTGYMMKEIEKILLLERPSCVVVFGDTNSTLAGALSASKIHIPVAHVESGLRSYNKRMPEEINRICTDHVSNYCFCPTQLSKSNLIKENIKSDITICGDIMLDTLNMVKSKLRFIKDIDILVTLHRQENVDNEMRLRKIIMELSRISEKRQICFTVHPRTRKAINKLNLDIGAIKLIPPLSYIDFLSHLKSCKLLVTDSGGAQKDAYYLKKFCVVLRTETEWVELVKNGVIKLSEPENLQNSIELMSPPEDWPIGVYGTGNTSEIITRKLKNVSNSSC